MPEFYHISDLRYNGNSGVWVFADRHNASGSACHYADDEREKLSGKDEQERMLALSASLMDEVKQELANIDLILTSDSSGSVDTNTSFNRPDDIILVMPC